MQPIQSENLSNELRDLIESVQPPLNIHRTIANHPALLTAFWPLRQHIVRANSLPPRQHELLILRVAHLCQADYEWQHHVQRGQQAGLTPAEIDQVRADLSVGWASADALILTCANELHANHQLTPATADAMQATFGKHGTLDAIFTATIYFGLAAILNTFHIPMERSQ
jgi:alkylhydroperoxidase family enzyme